MIGGGGNDAFVFSSAFSATNVDNLVGFSVAGDTLQLDSSAFDTLQPGSLASDAFFVGSAAHDAQDRIVYNSTTGAVLYDADGSGGGAAVQFATVSAGLGLTRNDFFVV